MVHHNERTKAFAAIADNIAVAFMVAGGAVWYDKRDLFNWDIGLAIFGTMLALATGWSLRAEIEVEEWQ